jgi:hypothetical protein
MTCGVPGKSYWMGLVGPMASVGRDRKETAVSSSPMDTRCNKEIPVVATRDAGSC